jgi:hypothetical protein
MVSIGKPSRGETELLPIAKTFLNGGMKMTNTRGAEKIINDLIEEGIKPADTFTASAGRDYGQVKAWKLDDGTYAIAYGDNGETNYAIHADADDLGDWLIHDDLGGIDRNIERANVYRLDQVSEAESGALCSVLIEQSYYGPYTRTDAARDERGDVLEFDNGPAAQQWIDQSDSGTYYLEHNETGRPAYKIVEL